MLVEIGKRVPEHSEHVSAYELHLSRPADGVDFYHCLGFKAGSDDDCKCREIGVVFSRYVFSIGYDPHQRV